MITIDLSGKTALITGASQGLGATTAARLHAAGANVGIVFQDDAQGIHRSKAEAVAGEMGARALAIPGDVRSSDQMLHAVTQIRERFGALDILVCNAGIVRDGMVKSLSDEEWQSVIQTNLSGVFHTCKAVVDVLSDGGRIINLTSLAATIGFFGQANYAAAKAGVVALTKVLSKELARRQITVNAVAPGVVLTEMGQAISETHREWMLTQIPLARFGEPHEVADCVLFLASELASYISGQTIHVNGGWWAA
jgi:3-oxoacyl-[acyl-carrier protein] reductase